MRSGTCHKSKDINYEYEYYTKTYFKAELFVWLELVEMLSKKMENLCYQFSKKH